MIKQTTIKWDIIQSYTIKDYKVACMGTVQQPMTCVTCDIQQPMTCNQPRGEEQHLTDYNSATTLDTAAPEKCHSSLHLRFMGAPESPCSARAYPLIRAQRDYPMDA